MKNFNTLCLGNRVFIDGRVFEAPGLEEGVITSIKGDEVEVIHRTTRKSYKCMRNQIEAIELDNMILTSLGFTERSMTDSKGATIKDKIKSTEPKEEEDVWYLISIQETKRGFFMTIKENGMDVLGSGFPKTLHQLQNMVRFITDEKYEI